MSAPEVSIVIPIYNEAEILRSSVAELQRGLAAIELASYEILLAENGSRDETVALATGLAAGDPRIRTFSCG